MAVRVTHVTDAGDAPGMSGNIARRHYARWSAARQERISTIMRLVHGGETLAAQTPRVRAQNTPAVQ
jgi:hypothetical protein